jgi:hypothetical protein
MENSKEPEFDAELATWEPKFNPRHRFALCDANTNEVIQSVTLDAELRVGETLTVSFPPIVVD